MNSTEIRNIGINPNYWYAVARSTEVKLQPLSVTLWEQSIVIYRDQHNQIHALSDRCPHRQVKLSHGQVINNYLECAYHGWQFNQQGKCVSVPYLAANQKLPNCQIPTYPVQELDGFIWIFPGDANLAHTIKPLSIPEWNHLNYIASVSVINCQAHYSFLIENLMDMYHGHLHQNWQAWTEAKLEKITVSSDRIDADYQAQSYYQIDQIWSISQLFFPALRRLHPQPLKVSYIYPHWRSTLGRDFTIYCLICPIDQITTRAYLIHFTSLHAFLRLHQLPMAFRRWLKNSLFGVAQKLLDGLVTQDVQMIEEEQQAYWQSLRVGNFTYRNYELNPALLSVQKLMIDLYQGDKSIIT